MALLVHKYLRYIAGQPRTKCEFTCRRSYVACKISISSRAGQIEMGTHSELLFMNTIHRLCHDEDNHLPPKTWFCTYLGSFVLFFGSSAHKVAKLTGGRRERELAPARVAPGPTLAWVSEVIVRSDSEEVPEPSFLAFISETAFLECLFLSILSKSFTLDWDS